MKPKKLITHAFQEVESKIANRIGGYVNRFPIRTRKIGLIVFGIVIGTFCFLLIIGFIGNADSKNAIRQDQLSIPKDIYTPAIDSVYRSRFDSIP